MSTPQLCPQYLSDKVNEAIASPARFRDRAAPNGQSAARLGTADYEAKMRDIFQECRRLLRHRPVRHLHQSRNLGRRPPPQ